MKIILLLALSLQWTLAQKVFAGSGSHAADLEWDNNNIWYLGEKPIEYCIQISADSKISMQKADLLIKAAIDRWQAFFEKYRLSTMSFGNGSPWNFPDGKSRKMSLSFEKKEKCTSFSGQLIFLFSKNASIWSTFVENHPLGAAIRLPYDHSTFRTGGTVWIQSQIPNLKITEHILLHELGHVFGMPHNSVWIMSDKAAQLASKLGQRSADTALLGRIESPAWKFRLRPGTPLIYRYAEASDTPSFDITARLPLNWVRGLDARAQAKNNPEYQVVLNTLDLSIAEDAGQNLRVTIRDLSGNTRELRGRLNRPSQSLNALGPSIYTQWIGNETKAVARLEKVLLERAAHQLKGNSPSYTGVLQLDGVDYPLTLEMQNGYTLKVYDPAEKRWLSFWDRSLDLR